MVQLPNQASKFWARIKGFFTSAWKAIKNIVPKVTKVVSPLIPPPYGTVVAGIGAGVSAVDNVINAVATSGVKQSSTLAGSVTVDDTDAFTLVPQFRLAPLGSSEFVPADITTSPDSDWQEGEAFTVRVNVASEQSHASRMEVTSYPQLY